MNCAANLHVFRQSCSIFHELSGSGPADVRTRIVLAIVDRADAAIAVALRAQDYAARAQEINRIQKRDCELRRKVQYVRIATVANAETVAIAILHASVTDAAAVDLMQQALTAMQRTIKLSL